MTYQNRGCSWKKATSDQPLLIEVMNSTEVFLPRKHKGCGEWEGRKARPPRVSQAHMAGQNSQGLLGSDMNEGPCNNQRGCVNSLWLK